MASVGSLVAAIAYEAVRLFVPWRNIGAQNSHAVSIGLIAVWSAAAALIVARRARKPISLLAWMLSFVAPTLMGLHAVLTRVLCSTYAGLPYAGLALLLIFSLRQLWRGENFPRPPRSSRLRRPPRPRPHGIDASRALLR